MKITRMLLTLIVALGMITILVGCTSDSSPEASNEPDQIQNTQAISLTFTESPKTPSATLETPKLEPTTPNDPLIADITPITDTIKIINSGFEQQESDGTPTGWNSSGDRGGCLNRLLAWRRVPLGLAASAAQLSSRPLGGSWMRCGEGWTWKDQIPRRTEAQ